ncbi:MAG: CbrC family protein [Planctomycetes bacterium]|nr:CbrC family protein [Planctomycetota bacterium]
MKLPRFKYHPDPLATGSVVASATRCACCGRSRGYVYTGPAYAVESYDDCICPWCIADGSAHEKLDVTFTCEGDIGCGGLWDAVPPAVVEEIAFRTPGFQGWEQSRWWTHCGDAAMFVGRGGRAELDGFDAEGLAVVRESVGLPDGPDWEEFLDTLTMDGSPRAYAFRCRKCGRLGGYADCD